MSIIFDPVAQALEDKRNEEERAYVASETKQRREHEYRLAKLEYSINTRHKMWMAIASSPAKLVLALTLPSLIKADKKIPQFLQDFMNS